MQPLQGEKGEWQTISGAKVVDTQQHIPQCSVFPVLRVGVGSREGFPSSFYMDPESS